MGSSGALSDLNDPIANITSPSTGPLAGLSVTPVCTYTDGPPEASGFERSDFYFWYCGGTDDACGDFGPPVFIGSDTTLTVTGSWPSPDGNTGVLWTFPSCGAMPLDRFQIQCYHYDKHGNLSNKGQVDVRLIGRGC